MSTEPETKASLMIRLIREQVQTGLSLEDATRRVMRRHSELTDQVMDQIGSWPSSDPELAMVQRLYK